MIAIGVPMVVYAATIARDALCRLMDTYQIGVEDHKEATEALMNQSGSGHIVDMVETPREIDEMVISEADLIAMGINRVLHSKVRPVLVVTFLYQPFAL